MGVGDVLASLPKVPRRVQGLVRKLNHFGGVSLSPQEVVLDGNDVPWEKVTEVWTRRASATWSATPCRAKIEALEAELDRFKRRFGRSG